MDIPNAEVSSHPEMSGALLPENPSNEEPRNQSNMLQHVNSSETAQPSLSNPELGLDSILEPSTTSPQVDHRPSPAMTTRRVHSFGPSINSQRPAISGPPHVPETARLDSKHTPSSALPGSPITVGRSHEEYQTMQTFQKIIEKAGRFCDHLKNGKLSQPSRWNGGVVNVLDLGGSTNRQLYEFVDEDIEPPNDEVILRSIPKDVTQRLIIIEDLYPRIIALLVSKFGVTPEFFEEHLLNSGYTGAQYDDSSSQSWSTSFLKKSYVSMKWFRPAWRLPVAPFSKHELEDLLDPEIPSLDVPGGKYNETRTIEAKTNIFRSQWDLWTDSRTTTRARRLCGWEERASIWKGKAPDGRCDLVILLLDPLPTLKRTLHETVYEASSLSSSQTSSNGGTGSRESGSHHSSTDPESGQSEFSGNSQSPYPASLRSRGRPEIKRRFSFDFDLQWLLKLVVKDKRAKPEPVVINHELPPQPVIEQISPRIHIDFSLEEAFQSPILLTRLQNQLFETTSTLSNFNDHLDNEVHEHDTQFGTLSPLFRIVRKDLLGFVKLLHNILDSIISEILDDTKMEDRLTIWRQIITRAELELPEIRASMLEFFMFLPQAKIINPATKMKPEETFVDKEFQECLTEIDRTLERLQTVSRSLTSNMALLDSRRSIAEAQNVTRLTELAFLFIPLTFAATLLGMQIDQFENRVPLSTFILLGVLFTGLSYGVRLTIRSFWFRTTVERSKESIKIYADSQQQPIQRGYVPTSIFLRWLLQSSWTWVKYAVASFWVSVWGVIRLLWRLLMISTIRPFTTSGLICVLPLTILWTRDLEYQIQVFFTIALLFSVTMVVFIIFWVYTGPKEQETFARQFKKEFDRFMNGKSTIFPFVIWVGSACIFLALIIVLWRGPTSSGVKTFFTIALILSIVLALIFFGIYKLVGDAMGYNRSNHEGESENEDSS